MIDFAESCIISMGVDHRVDRGTCPPYFLKYGGRNVFCPPYFLGEEILITL